MDQKIISQNLLKYNQINQTRLLHMNSDKIWQIRQNLFISLSIKSDRLDKITSHNIHMKSIQSVKIMLIKSN